MFVTERVQTIRRIGDKWCVRFVNSDREYSYRVERLVVMGTPEIFDLETRSIFIENCHVHDAESARLFSDGSKHSFYYVTFSSKRQPQCFKSQKIYISRTTLDELPDGLWGYLKKLADETGLLVDGDRNILSKMYALVDLGRDNVPLAQFLGDKEKLKTYRLSNTIIYPFGCNASQKQAVENALSSQLSIIQGPPGTGKTQTILNIIANLLLKGMSVLVVSNNNLAVQNIAEKLAKPGVDLKYLVAMLGRAENKETFIANQPGYPDMESWKLQDKSSTLRDFCDSFSIVTKSFELSSRKSSLLNERSALLIEQKHHEQVSGKPNIEWLESLPSKKLIALYNGLQMLIDAGRKPNLPFRIKWALLTKLAAYRFLGRSPESVLETIHSAYYSSRLSEIESEIVDVDVELNTLDCSTHTKRAQQTSLALLKDYLASQRTQSHRPIFEKKDLKYNEEFLKEYPIVLSTTYTARNNISSDRVFDYVIMDEASQVNIVTGALTLACGTNVVIVGDTKQLPDVVTESERLARQTIEDMCGVNDEYRSSKYSFLECCCRVFKDSPSTLLKEHYRCHPKIIEFCNKMFYDGQLITMTTDNGEDNVVNVTLTTPGNHARGHFNQREIDVITQEILTSAPLEELGIIAPYNNQCDSINQIIKRDIASTVHKFQGRECNVIVMSFVDNQPTSFSDDPNLLNVAISRAKDRLHIVATGNDIPKDSILSQLIGYCRYNNCDIRHSRLRSVFDYLYKQNSLARLEYEKNHPLHGDYLSERLVLDLFSETLSEIGCTTHSILQHYKMCDLVCDTSSLNEDERAYATNPTTHIDLLLYNIITKTPTLAIEIDGWHFHQSSESQIRRDQLKNNILEKLALPIERISTVQTVNQSFVMAILSRHCIR